MNYYILSQQTKGPELSSMAVSLTSLPLSFAVGDLCYSFLFLKVMYNVMIFSNCKIYLLPLLLIYIICHAGLENTYLISLSLPGMIYVIS